MRATRPAREIVRVTKVLLHRCNEFAIIAASLERAPSGGSARVFAAPTRSHQPQGSRPEERIAVMVPTFAASPLHPVGAALPFLLATGIECSAPVIRGGIRRDELRLTGHWDRVEEDLDLVRELGIDWLRYGIPFHVVAAGPVRDLGLGVDRSGHAGDARPGHRADRGPAPLRRPR